MNLLTSFAAVLIAIFSTSAANAQSNKTETFKVYGNCNMCKNRIEKSLSAAGIRQANWNIQTKEMKVTYDSSKINIDQIQQRITAVGHDTEKHKAADSIYEKLPGCCRYDRNSAAPASSHKHH